MTVDVARRPRRRAPAKAAAPEPVIAAAPSIAIGEIDQTIFECPSCSRPLALGAKRCPGCGTRLLRSVALGKAAGFIAAGMAVGLLVGAGSGLAVGLTQASSLGFAAAPVASAKLPAAAATGTTGPTATAAAPTPTARPTAAPTDPAGMPPLARTALVQIVGTNDRLAAAGVALRAAADARSFDASEVAQVLRTISAESVFSEQLALHVGVWSGSAALGTQLTTFYDAIHETAANGLVASVRNEAAYRAAATAMLKLLDGMPAIDAAVRTTAESAGVELPAG